MLRCTTLLGSAALLLVAASSAGAVTDYDAAGMPSLSAVSDCAAAGKAVDTCIGLPAFAAELPSPAAEALQAALKLYFLSPPGAELQAALSRAVEAAPDHAELRHFVARIHVGLVEQRGLTALAPAAEAHLAAADKLGGASAPRTTTRALLQLALGEVETAERTIDAALALDPDFPEALYARSQLRLARGEQAAAMDDVDRAVAARPQSLHLRGMRAEINMHVGRFDLAAKDIDVILAVRPQDFIMREQRALARGALGDARGAIEDLSFLLEGPAAGQRFALGAVKAAELRQRRAMHYLALQQPAKASDDMLASVDGSGKQGILRLQVFLRSKGFPDLPLDGQVSDRLKAALQSCFGAAACLQGMFQRT